MPEMIYLRESAPRGEIRGHVVGCSLPLQPVMRKRWDEGDLVRVTEDGEPWPGGDFLPDDVPDADAVPKDEPAAADEPLPVDIDGTDEPARPRGNASQDAWAAYAVALGELSEDQAAGMSRDDIVAAVSPAAG